MEKGSSCPEDNFFLITSRDKIFIGKDEGGYWGRESFVIRFVEMSGDFPECRSHLFSALYGHLVSGSKQAEPVWHQQVEILSQWGGSDTWSKLCPNFEVQAAYTVFLWLSLLVPVISTQLEDTVRFGFLQICLAVFIRTGGLPCLLV